MIDVMVARDKIHIYSSHGYRHNTKNKNCYLTVMTFCHNRFSRPIAIASGAGVKAEILYIYRLRLVKDYYTASHKYVGLFVTYLLVKCLFSRLWLLWSESLM